MPETSRRPIALEGVPADYGRLVDTALHRYLPRGKASPVDRRRVMRCGGFVADCDR
jgi:hypothetical protein